MTNQSILAAVDNWARELHLKFSAEILSEPPPILDFQHLTIPYQRPTRYIPKKITPRTTPKDIWENSSGVFLKIEEPEVTVGCPVSLSLWIHPSGIGSSCIMGSAGDIKNQPEWLQYRDLGKSPEQNIITCISHKYYEFFRKLVLEPAFLAWIEKRVKGHKKRFDYYHIVPNSIDGREDDDFSEWLIALIYPYPKNPNHSITVGFTEFGEVAIFEDDPDEDTVWPFRDLNLKRAKNISGIKKPSELFKWLDQQIPLTE
jgi:hypothetical protein